MVLNSRVVLLTIIVCLVLTPIAVAEPETDPLHSPADEETPNNQGNVSTANVAPSIAWEQTYGGTDHQGWNDLIKLDDGGYLLIGSTTQDGTHDALIMEVDANGNQEWERTYGGTANDTFRAGVEADSGGYILVGETISNGISGTTTGWIVKIDSSGNKQWERTYGGQGTDKLKDVVNANDGEYVAVGHREPNPDEDFDRWAVKIDGSGDALWSKTWSDFSDENDYAYGVVEVQQEFLEDDYIIVGHQYRGEDERFDAYVTKVDDSGFEWDSKTYGGSEGDFFYDIEQTSNADYVMTGYHDARWNSTGGYYDDGSVSIFKIGEDLGSFWQRTYGGSEEDIGRDIIQLADGGFVVGGYSHSMGEGVYDGYAVKVNPNGAEQWEEVYGGEGSDYFLATTNTSSGHLIVAGDNEQNSDTDAWLAQLGGSGANADPTASFSVNRSTIHPNEAVKFTANASDPDGNSLSYSWNFGDDTSATGKSVTHSYTNSGTYNVTLTVTDGNGGKDTVAQTVTVERESTGSNESSGNGFLTVTDKSDTISPGGNTTVTYSIENQQDAVASYTLEIGTSMNISVMDITGDIQSTNLDNSPPSASTSAIDAGEAGSVTVTLTADKNATGTVTANATAREPLSGSRDYANSSFTISTAPTSPRERALQIVGVNNPAAITQNDVTATITRFNRGLSVNGIDIKQDDVTVLITLFERNN